MPPLGSKTNKAEPQSAIFEYFRETCVTVVKNPSLEPIKALHYKLQEFDKFAKVWTTKADGRLLSPLLDYISFPLLMVCKNNCSWQVKEECLACLRCLLGLAVCSSARSFMNIFTSCIGIIADTENPGTVSKCSEELKLSALQVLSELVKNTSQQVLLPLYSTEQFRVQIGHAIFLFLKIAQHETNRFLRIAALETVCKFSLEDTFLNKIRKENTDTSPTVPSTSVHNDDIEIPPSIFTVPRDRNANKGTNTTSKMQAVEPETSSDDNEMQRRAAREALSTFLPGICSASAKIAVADETKGHKLTLASMKALRVILVVVLEDSFMSSVLGSHKADTHSLLRQKMNITTEPSLSSSKTKDHQDLKNPASPTITESWLEATRTKVAQLVEGVFCQLVSHSHVSVRRELVLLAGSLLCQCSRSVPGLVIPCIEALATLAADHSPQVNSYAKSALRERRLHDHLEKSLIESDSLKTADKHSSIKPSLCSKDGGKDGVSASATNERNFSMAIGDNAAAPGKESNAEDYISENSSLSSCEALNSVNTTDIDFKLSSFSSSQPLKAKEDDDSGGLSQEIRSTLQERICRAVKRLPTAARSSDGRSVATLVRRLRGYIALLGGGELRQLLLLPGQGAALLVSLASCLALDSRDRDLLLRRPSADDVWNIPALPCALGERRQFLRDADVVRECQDVAASVGLCLTPVMLLQTWADAVSSAQHLTPELVSMLPGLLSGYATTKRSRTSSSQEEKEQFVDSLLNFLLSEETLFAPTDFEAMRCTKKSNNFTPSPTLCLDDVCDANPPKSNNISDSLEHIYSRFNSPFNPCVNNAKSSLAHNHGTSESGLSLYVCQRNVLTVSHSLLAVAACARVMGPSFIMFFSRVMCPLLEMCGDSNLLVAHSARKSLEQMSQSCGHGSVVELVEAAVPHFWYPLSMQLRRPRLHPRAPLILQVALACSRQGSSACLTDCLQQLMYELLRCLDSHESLCPQQLLVVLKLYMAIKQQEISAKPQEISAKPQEISANRQEVSTECQEVSKKHKDLLSAIKISNTVDHALSFTKREGVGKFTVQHSEAEINFSASKGSEETHSPKVEISNAVTCHNYQGATNDNADSSVTNVTRNDVNKENELNNFNRKSDNCTVQNSDQAELASECSNVKSNSNALESLCDGDNSNHTLGPLAVFLKELHAKEKQLKEKFDAEQVAILEEVNSAMQKEEEKARAAGKAYWEKTSDDFAQNPEKDGSDSGIDATKDDKNASDIEDAEEASPEESIKPKEEEIPEDVRLIVSILERCCFLLHTRDRDTSLVLLDTIELGCQALKQWENSQLPVLHKVWKPLMLRIKDQDRPVSLRALTVCCVMVANSGDFLRKRCLNDLLPALSKFLVMQSSVSRCQTARTGYFMSAAYNTQHRLLDSLYPQLVDKLHLSGAEMVHAVNCYALYLDCSQPPALMQASMRGLRAASVTHPETVWFALSRLLPPRVVLPPTPGHQLLKLDGGLVSNKKQLPVEAQQLFDELS